MHKYHSLSSGSLGWPRARARSRLARFFHTGVNVGPSPWPVEGALNILSAVFFARADRARNVSSCALNMQKRVLGARLDG